MSTEDEVREASSRFYAALNQMLQGDAGPMADVWSHTATVTSMHPIGGREVGWDEVRESFAKVAGLSSRGQVSLDEQRIRVDGNMAYEVAVEKGQAVLGGQPVTIDHRVTNVYRREGSVWKIVHHHTDPSSAMLDLVARLQAGS